MIYTDIDFEYHSHMLVEEIGTEGHIHLYLRVLLNPHDIIHEVTNTSTEPILTSVMLTLTSPLENMSIFSPMFQPLILYPSIVRSQLGQKTYSDVSYACFESPEYPNVTVGRFG